MSLTFLMLILVILAIVVFILAFREPLSRFASGNTRTPQNTPTSSPIPQPTTTRGTSNGNSIIVIDGGSPTPQKTATPTPKADLRTSTTPKASPSPTPQASPSQKPKTTETKEDLKSVVLFFTKVDDEGRITMQKVSRAIKFNDSPLSSSVNALLKGPSGSELSNGVVSMIPNGTMLLSAWVRDSIAYLNFSENFQFNPLGADGLRAQVRQVVWVATEFPTVKAVQILIEGKNVEYLGGDNVPVGKPISRQNSP
jgi:germination protein M